MLCGDLEAGMGLGRGGAREGGHKRTHTADVTAVAETHTSLQSKYPLIGKDV